MATITLDPFMPARCWMAPEMPAAMYSSGATTLPVWPTCQSFGTQPASTAARLAPPAAPSSSASASTSLKARLGELGPGALHLRELDEADLERRWVDVHRRGGDAPARALHGRRELGRAHGEGLDRRRQLHLGEDVARPHGPAERDLRSLAAEGEHLGGRGRAQARRRAGEEVLPERSRRRPDVRRLHRARDVGDD